MKCCKVCGKELTGFCYIVFPFIDLCEQCAIKNNQKDFIKFNKQYAVKKYQTEYHIAI